MSKAYKKALKGDKLNSEVKGLLEINSECRKGIFFVRLKGELTKENYLILRGEVTDLVKDNGIRNIVFNLHDLNKIDMKGISELYYNFEMSKKNKGIGFLCGINDNINRQIKSSRITKYMNEISDELSAFNLI